MRTSTAQLSDRVLAAAAACVPSAHSEQTARRLYHGNWLPASPRRLAQFGDAAAVYRFAVDGEVRRRLSDGWVRSEDQDWTHWASVHRDRRPSGRKVYVSVLPEALPAALRQLVAALDDERVAALKLARQPRGLLRPDRLVVYCSRADPGALVARLAAELSELPAHGVPFTAGAAASAAVSWAWDPPWQARSRAPSWRRWIVRRLAGYLHASDAPSTAGRVAFALDRVERDGVDVRSWAPTPDVWECR